MCHQICWLYWDPPRKAFTVPFINHPVFWYGILFVGGFALAYFLINPLLARFLTQIRYISPLDIKNWPLLIDQLRISSSPIISSLKTQFDPLTKEQIKQKEGANLTAEFKQRILDGLNQLLKSTSISREELQEIFPQSLASTKQTAYLLADRLCWFAVVGTVIGARLGDVFFYNWSYFREHPVEILKIWNGGLASHGGVLGVMLALYLYTKMIQRSIPQLSFLYLLDLVCVPTALVACFIRLGNFMNQEIIGIPTDLPWGVLFGHPADQVTAVPRHPVQLYEAIAYFITFIVLWQMWKKQPSNEKPGALVGMMFILIFGSRFILEFWKNTQESSLIDSSFLQAGQILSIPFILLGIFLYAKARYCNRQLNASLHTKF